MNSQLQIADSEPIVEEADEINVELLLRLAEHIESHPDEFDMDEWVGRTRRGSWLQRVLKIGPCFTTHCIAGAACELSNASLVNPPAIAQRLLGLTYEQANRLFYVWNWPEPYCNDYGSPEHAPTNAWVAGQRIRHFVATNGED